MSFEDNEYIGRQKTKYIYRNPVYDALFRIILVMEVFISWSFIHNMCVHIILRNI